MLLDIDLLLKIFWSGVAAAGFSILFNVPNRTVISVFILGAIAGFIKFLCLKYNVSIVLASLAAASFVGFTSLLFAHYKNTSPFIISIPSVIPMIPGYFGYKTLIGLAKLVMYSDIENKVDILLSVNENFLKMLFILIALSIGVSIPWLIFKNKGLKKIKITHEDDLI